MKIVNWGKISTAFVCICVLILSSSPVWASTNIDIGPGAQAGSSTSQQNLAVGANAQAGTGENQNGNTAIGDGAIASGTETTAIGAGAVATHNNSVALGAGSVTDRDNSVSVGNRQITNVLDGTADLDAVNVRQLNRVSSRLDKVGSMAAAMSALTPIAYDPEQPTQMSIGGGLYQGQGAVALGVYHYTKPGVLINTGVAISSGETMGRVGATWKLGKSKKEKEVTALPAVAPAEKAVTPASSLVVSEEPAQISLSDITE